MRDCKGNKLSVGDRVVFILNTSLEIGVITKIYSDMESCTVGNHTHIFSHRILKLS